MERLPGQWHAQLGSRSADALSGHSAHKPDCSPPPDKQLSHYPRSSSHEVTFSITYASDQNVAIA